MALMCPCNVLGMIEWSFHGRSYMICHTWMVSQNNRSFLLSEVVLFATNISCWSEMITCCSCGSRQLSCIANEF